MAPVATPPPDDVQNQHQHRQRHQQRCQSLECLEKRSDYLDEDGEDDGQPDRDPRRRHQHDLHV
jgi:hypothetical protein